MSDVLMPIRLWNVSADIEDKKGRRKVLGELVHYEFGSLTGRATPFYVTSFVWREDGKERACFLARYTKYEQGKARDDFDKFCFAVNKGTVKFSDGAYRLFQN